MCVYVVDVCGDTNLVVCNSLMGVVTCETASDSDNMFEMISSTKGAEHNMHTRELVASNPDRKPPHPSSCVLIVCGRDQRPAKSLFKQQTLGWTSG